MSKEDPFGSLPRPLGNWVEWRSEQCRRERALLTLVNHRDGRALHLSPDDLDPSDRERFATTVALLETEGFTRPAGPISAPPQRSTFVWRGADRFVRRCHRAGARRLLGRRAMIVQALIAVAGIVALICTAREGPPNLHARAAQIPAVLLLGLAAVMVHEFGHAIVTIHYGRTVRQAGFGLHLGTPAFYVESNDALLLERRQRIVQAVAGPWAEWMFTSCVAVAFLFVPQEWVGAPLLHRFVIVNTIGILSNLVPFVGLDGALILSDVVREADLPFRSRTAILRSADRDLFLTAYTVLDTLAASALLALAGFFWWELFGQLLADLGSSVGGRLLLAVFVALFVVRIARRRGMRILAPLRRAWSHLRFRLQRAWRVRATLALANLPALAALDEDDLAVVAGLLERRRVAEIERCGSTWAAAFVGGRRSAAVVRFADDGAAVLCGDRATLLPNGWEASLRADRLTEREAVAAVGGAETNYLVNHPSGPWRSSGALCKSAPHFSQGDG
jgi:hypothetical protein